MSDQLRGLWPPVATPFHADGSVDETRFVAHARWLLDDGAHGLAILGTTSEANSLTLDERRRVIDLLLESGMPARRLLPGTDACALEDAALLSRHAARAGCAAVLLLPTFFHKGVGDDGLHAYAARLIERLGADVPRVLLYHIPQMAGVGWSLDLIARLRGDFPEIIVGLKDSSGDWHNTRAVLESFPGFAVFPASEAVLGEALALGAAGCISATANVNAGGVRALFDGGDGPDRDRRQTDATALRMAVQSYPMIPAVKEILAARHRAPDWRLVRPPLEPLDEGVRAKLLAEPAVARLLANVPA